MSPESISKFQPDRTFYLRGFTGFGAAASLCETSTTGCTTYGVFRDMADFCVLVVYDADNIFEHYSIRHLPDFDVSGIRLTFDLTYQGLQPIDSSRYSWIDWAQLDVIAVDPESNLDLVSSMPPKVRLWDHATLKSGNYAVAQGSYSITAPGGCGTGDRITLFINDVAFDFTSRAGGETAAAVAASLADLINTHDWSSYADTSAVVTASSDSNGTLTLKNGRTGIVNVDGNIVSLGKTADGTWLGTAFPGLAAGSSIYINGNRFTVASVANPGTLFLTTSAGVHSGVPYLTEYGGVDGNSTTTYMLSGFSNRALSVDRTYCQLSGGNSDNVTWTIDLDFSNLGYSHIRQAWFTFAPNLTAGGAYLDTEWKAVFSNWTVNSANDNLKLPCAAPGSMRIGNDDKTACIYGPAEDSGWAGLAANNYWRGYGQTTAKAGDSVSVTYTCLSNHTLYLGTSLYPARGVVDVSLDGDLATGQNCFLSVGSEVVTRRLLRETVGPGTHTVTFTLKNGTFLFDYIEAAVPGEIPAPLVTYPNVSPALDFDTDATYKVSPQRLLWHLAKLGFHGQINEYLGVFWWNQRKRVNAVWSSIDIIFSGQWNEGDVAVLYFDGVPMKKTLSSLDTLDTIAAHFVHYVNAGSIIIRAEKTGTGQLTIYTRTPNWRVAFSKSQQSANGAIRVNGLTHRDATEDLPAADFIDYGADGTWQIDASASNPLNFPVRQWHADFFSDAKSQDLLVTTSFSMELVNPPDDDGTVANTWRARFASGASVETDTGFAKLTSAQCAPVPNLTEFQKRVFTAMAELQNAAGLTPWLQFGEFLWWFFSDPDKSKAQAVGYCSYTDPISIGVAVPHGMSSGDRVVISGVGGCTTANGTWPIAVTDATHFTIPVSGNGEWIPGTGQVRGGSMAYYDAVTTAAAEAALGRPLYKFTCQDDDPSVNEGADADFLAAQLKAHVDGIRNAVLNAFPNARFEILFPNDVNNAVCYLGPDVQYPQGGRLNAHVNLPGAWRSKDGSGLDRFKVEALSWGATYSNLNLASEAITLAITEPFSWDPEDVAYLVPWFNGICPWRQEYHWASTLGLGLINFWAYDHLSLLSWPLPLAPPVKRSFRKF